MKPITKVFLVIGVLVLCMVVWGAFFNTGGMLETAWNAVVTPVNKTWGSIVGDDKAELVPTMEIKNHNTEDLNDKNKTGGGAGN